METSQGQQRVEKLSRSLIPELITFITNSQAELQKAMTSFITTILPKILIIVALMLQKSLQARTMDLALQVPPMVQTLCQSKYSEQTESDTPQILLEELILLLV